jgi:hypothetical protein
MDMRIPLPLTLRVHAQGHVVPTANGSRQRLTRPVLVWFVALLCAWLLVLTGLARGETLYVDSRLGDDRNDGLTASDEGGGNGPLRTLRRALEIAQQGDEVRLTNNGAPYYGGVTLFGDRHSGRPGGAFTITGNGAVLSGAKPVPEQSWELVRGTIWRLVPVRKAYYQLLLDGSTIPEAACPPDAKTLPDLQVGQWCAWRGAIYYRTEGGGDPNRMNFALADDEAGLTLLDVHDVVIRDLTLRHFRLDGVNAHDRCREVLLERVTSTENGRAGATVAGTSQIYLLDSELTANRVHSLLITERGEADLEECKLDRPPTAAVTPAAP